MMEDRQFKGRKGQKRLKELNERIEQTLSLTDGHAAGSQEMEFILKSIPDPVTRLGFLESYRILDDFWGGIQSIGFIRLCARWIKGKKLTQMDRQKIDEMFLDILPTEEIQKIRVTLRTQREAKK